MPTTRKNKIIEHGFNFNDSYDFFETRVTNLEPKEVKKKFLAAAKQLNYKRSLKNCKQEESDSSVVESSEESTVGCRTSKKYCILNGKCSHSMGNCKVLRSMVIKHKHRKKINFKS